MKHKPLKESRVLVIGATSQVGQAIAKAFDEAGASLVITGRDSEKLEAMSASLQNVQSVELDLGDHAGLQKQLPSLQKQAVNINHIVFTVAPPVAPVKISDQAFFEELKKHLDISVLGFTGIFQALNETLLRPGSITAVLTEYIIGAPPDKTAAYVSAKLALQGLFKSLAIELGPEGVRCNTVSPGMINTPYSSFIPVRLKQIEEAKNPLRRLCAPEDVANTVRFLASPEAAFINGVNLPVNGGSTMI